jgi:hypothetical protein
VAAALLGKVRAELTSQQAQIVDTLKRQCPTFAVMRKLVFGFRAILRGGKVTTLHRWMEEARETGIHSLVRFVRTLKQDLTKRSGSGGERTVEQRAGGRTHKPTQNAEATNVWACRYRTAPRSPTTRAGTHGSIMLHQNCVRAELSAVVYDLSAMIYCI